MFILGRDYELSMLELLAYMEKNGFEYSIKNFSEQAALVNIDEKFTPQTAMKSLGGIVKIGIVLKNLENVYEGSSNKISYAISFYGKNNKVFIEENIKKAFKKQRLKAFYKKPKRKNSLMPTEVLKKALLEEGIEFLAYNNMLAKTIAVFDPFEHEKRDQEMPCKDYLKTISIRLAKILINLSQAKKLLLDPFCGYGVILQEATLQGIDAIGIDLDIKSVAAAKKNLEHIEKKYGVTTKYKIIQGDSRRLSHLIKEADGIATEPYLGPYIKQTMSFQEAKKIMTELEQTYRRVLEEAKKVVQGKIAIIVPRFQTRQRKDVTMGFENLIKSLGYKIWQPLKQIKNPIIYPYGKIIREIWVIEPKT